MTAEISSTPSCGTSTISKGAEPFLRWPGGKRWLVEQYSDVFPQDYNRYIEPFVGAGSVFFHMCPTTALLSDTNHELIGTYEAIRDSPHAVYAALVNHASAHTRSHYYDVRASPGGTPVEQAARLLYLNRACFNGLYRVNRAGAFNVPIGDTRNLPGSFEQIQRASEALQDVTMQCRDFASSVALAGAGDLVYLDPPYTVPGDAGAFLRYNRRPFTWSDQLRLMRSSIAAVQAGAQVVISNAYDQSVADLYASSGAFVLHRVRRNSTLAAATTKRTAIDELLVLSNDISSRVTGS